MRLESPCGGVLYANESEQTLTLPSYPLAYPANLSCVWAIVAPANQKVEINVTDIDMGGDSENLFRHGEIGIQGRTDGERALPDIEVVMKENKIV